MQRNNQQDWLPVEQTANLNGSLPTTQAEIEDLSEQLEFQHELVQGL